MSYTVLVDDNFHYMNEDERYSLGEYETLDAAIRACRKLVDDFLLEHYKPGMSAVDLYGGYVSFGEDPFIIVASQPSPFSGWDYARQRCDEICQNESNR